MGSSDFLLFIVMFLLAIGITGLMKFYAQRAGLLDVPNHRSSHELATPRGGGLSIIFVFLGVVLVLMARGDVDRNTAFAFLVGGGLVAAIGLVDDHSHVSPKWRILVQIVAAALASA